MSSALYAHLKIGACDIAVPVANILQAMDLPAEGATPVPRREGAVPGALDGVIEFDGVAVPVVALHRWLPLGEAGSKHDARIVLLRAGESMIGIRVDALLGIKRLQLSAIRTVCHDSSEEELFESVVPADAAHPLLCLLEVARLMKLAAVWCDAAELAPAHAAVAAASVPQHAKTFVRHVVLTIGNHLWALPASSVARLADTPQAELRLAGQRVCGIGTWEDRKIPLVDLGFSQDRAGVARPRMAVMVDGEHAIGLVADSCDGLVNLAVEDMFLTADDELRTGTVTIPGRGEASVLDTVRLFAAVPEATISRASQGAEAPRAARAVSAVAGTVARRGADTASGPSAEAAVHTDYLVFDADRPYASPAVGLVGVVALSDSAIEALAEGRPASVEWRGETLGVLNLPRLDGGKASFAPCVAVVVKAAGAGAVERRSAIAVRSLSRWLPARSAQRSSMRIHSVGDVNVVTPTGRLRSESLVVVDLAQMSYLLG